MSCVIFYVVCSYMLSLHIQRINAKKRKMKKQRQNRGGNILFMYICLE